jgi:hypothetical protein
MSDAGLSVSQEKLDFFSRRKGRARSEPRTAHGRHSRGNASTFCIRQASGEAPRERAMKGVAGARRVDDINSECGLPAALSAAGSPDVAFHAHRHAGMANA